MVVQNVYNLYFKHGLPFKLLNVTLHGSSQSYTSSPIVLFFFFVYLLLYICTLFTFYLVTVLLQIEYVC